MELKIVGQIPLEQLERFKKKRNPEIFLDDMKKQMELLVEKNNNRFGDILEKDGRVKITNDDDAKFIKIKEGAWASEYGLSLDEYQRKQEKNKGYLAEMAITLTLAKAFGDRFLSVRASKHDDYENGVDNIVLDTETGVVVCGLDEVYNDIGAGDTKKDKKVMEKFDRGGARLKYGLKLNKDNNQITVSSLNNLPTFYIAINQEDLLNIMENSAKPELSSCEKKIIEDLISSLKLQLEKMTERAKDKNINWQLEKNLQKMPDIIKVLEEKIKTE